MPNPRGSTNSMTSDESSKEARQSGLTNSERALLMEDLRDLAERNPNWMGRAAKKAAAELTRTADDARDAERYRYIRDCSGARNIYLTTLRCGGEPLDNVIDAALASSKSDRIKPDQVKPVAADQRTEESVGGEDERT